MKDILITIWKWLDGNKSIILLSVANAMQQAMLMDVIAKTNLSQYIVWLLFAISGGTIWQHVQKQINDSNPPVQ
jgi:hypothetical protein